MSYKKIKKILVSLSLFGLFSVFALGGAVSPAGALTVSADAGSHTVAAFKCNTTECDNLFKKYLNPFIKLLSAAIGVLVVLSVIIGGVQYSAAGSDPQQVAAARKRIGNALLGLVAYIFLFALLNWLVPGGIL